MNCYALRLAAKALFSVAAVSAFVSVASTALSVQAQSARPRTIPGSPGAEAVSTREMMERNQREREFNLRNLGAPVKTSDEDQWLLRQKQRELLQQVQKDYRQIQVLNNQLLPAAAQNAPLDYKQLAEKSAEMNKRASRLRTLLALPKPADESDKRAHTGVEATTNGRNVRVMVVMLDRSIMSFVGSPFFKSPSVIDLELTNRVSRDLHSIIELSRSINKTAEWLNKNPGTRE